MKKMFFGLLIIVGMFFVIGCDTSLARYSSSRNKVADAKIGWGPNDVVTKIGEPMRVERGEGINMGNDKWIYPTGIIYMNRLKVVKIKVFEDGEAPPDETKDYMKQFLEDASGMQ